jgi:hypothetical protein
MLIFTFAVSTPDLSPFTRIFTAKSTTRFTGTKMRVSDIMFFFCDKERDNDHANPPYFAEVVALRSLASVSDVFPLTVLPQKPPFLCPFQNFNTSFGHPFSPFLKMSFTKKAPQGPAESGFHKIRITLHSVNVKNLEKGKL